MFLLAKTLSPETLLFLNDYGIITDRENAHSSRCSWLLAGKGNLASINSRFQIFWHRVPQSMALVRGVSHLLEERYHSIRYSVPHVRGTSEFPPVRNLGLPLSSKFWHCRIKEHLDLLWEEFKIPIWVTEFNWNKDEVRQAHKSFLFLTKTLPFCRHCPGATTLFKLHSWASSTGWCSAMR